MNVRPFLTAILLPVGLAATLLILVFLGALPAAFGLVASCIVVAMVYWPLRDRIPNILLVFMSVFLVLTIIRSPAPRLASEPGDIDGARRSWIANGKFDERRPAIIHLIFDEMMSPGGIDETLPGGADMRAALYSLGEHYGLRTYDSVYSRSFFSGVSIPNLFNAEWLGRTGLSDRFPGLLEKLPDNAYFDEMASRGYRTAVFQTSHLDFCKNPRVELCETFASFDPGVLTDGEFDLPSRAIHVTNTLLRSYEPSYFSRYGQRFLARFTPGQKQLRILGTDGRFDVQRFPTWFDRFIAFVEEVPRGAHVFGHFMVPHGPYLLTEECILSDNGGVGYYLGTRVPGDAARADARRDYYVRYLAQLNCVTRRIGAFFEAVKRNPNLRDATIIVHGDHGSSISVGNLVEDYEREDFIANYATYFAVRGPGVAPGVDCEFLSLPEVFRRHAGGAERSRPLDRALPPVVVKTKAGDDLKVEAPMPRFGCALHQGSGEVE